MGFPLNGSYKKRPDQYQANQKQFHQYSQFYLLLLAYGLHGNLKVHGGLQEGGCSRMLSRQIWHWVSIVQLE